VLWGTLDSQSVLHEVAPSVTGLGEALPAVLRPADLSFEIAEERFQFQRRARASFVLKAAETGWHSRRGTILLPMLYTKDANVLVSDEAILLVSGELTPAESRRSALRAALTSPMVRTLCFLRKSEVKGWRRRGRGLDVYCVMTSEDYMVPSGKATLRLTSRDPEVLSLLRTLAPEAPSPRDLDRSVALGLPRGKPTDVVFLTMLAPVLLALVGFFSALVVALSFSPGSPPAVASIAVGMVFLFGGLLGAPIVFFLLRRRQKREGATLQDVLWGRAGERFLRTSGALSRQFADWAGRVGVPLDFSPQSIARLPSLEPILQSRAGWLPSVYRYGAYLGEVLMRDVGHRIRGEWLLDEGRLGLGMAETNTVVDVVSYARNRLRGGPSLPPQERYRRWRTVAFLSQAAQPLDLFTSLGIERDRILRDPEVLEEVVESVPRDGERQIQRPFGSYVVRRRPIAEGVFLQYQAILRTEEKEILEEPRALRPIFENPTVNPGAVLEVFELPSQVEALIAADYGGTPGQPLVAVAMVIDYLSVPTGSLGAGQTLPIRLGGIAVSGEFVPPVSGGGAAQAQISGFGLIQPSDPGRPMSPRMRISGIVEAPRTLAQTRDGVTLIAFNVNILGIRFPILADTSRIRGRPIPGYAFSGEVWFQARVSRPPTSVSDVSVA